MARGKQNKEGRLTNFFTPLNPFGENPDEEAPSDDFTIPKKVHYHSNWKPNQDAVCWVQVSRARDRGLRFWQTKSRAITVHNPVPADCICRVISQKGDRTLFERLSTPRPAPKVTLKSGWHLQQQQPLSGDVPSSSGKPVAVEIGKRDVRGYTTDDQTSTGKLVRNSVSPVDKKATIRNRSSSG